MALYSEDMTAATVLSHESECILPAFNSDIAWEIGCKARELGLSKFPGAPIKIEIITASGEKLFHSVIGDETTIDNDNWVRRKQNVVLKFQHSSYYVGLSLLEKGRTLTATYSYEEKDHACHGGAFPLRVKHCHTIVGILTISGLKQYQDHSLVVETLKLFS